VTIPARFPRSLEAAAIVLMLVAGTLSLRGIVLGDSANSRLATAYALVHYGTWYITDKPAQPNPFEPGTVDKVERDGERLSTKPPVLPLLMTAEYWVLHKALGWSLNVRDPERVPQARAIVRVMVVTLMLLPMAAGLVAFSACLGLLGAGPWGRAFLVTAFALGSEIPGFVGHINNHTPAAAALAIAAWCALGPLLGKAPANPARFAGFGFAGGMVFTLDLPETIYIAALGLVLLWRFPKQAILWGGTGLALPLLVHFGALLISTGSILPVQLHPGWYLYESAYWRNPGGVDALYEPKGTYLFHMTFGRYGTFALFPVLALGLGGALWALLGKGGTPARRIALGGLACFAILTAYYVLKTNNYGGTAYGFRWHLASAPVLLAASLPLLQQLRHKAWSIALLALLAVSMFSAWECYQDPWAKDIEWTARYLWGPAV
jgi:hypothetical protein